MTLAGSSRSACKPSRYSDFRFAACVAFSVLFSALSLVAQEDHVRLSGIVRDQSGAAISGATVRISGNGFVREAQTSNSGAFSFSDLHTDASDLEMAATGCGLQKRTISTGSGAELQIELTPASVVEEVVVTPSGREVPLSETAESVTVIGRNELNQTAAIAFDDALRQVPG